MNAHEKPSNFTLQYLANPEGLSIKVKTCLQEFVKRLTENPGAITVRDISIVSVLTKTSPEALLHLGLCWSEGDLPPMEAPSKAESGEAK